MKKSVVYLGADHAGYALKEKIKRYFDKKGIDYFDLGGNGDEGDDYPDYAFKVAERVASDRNSVGILICGTGTGMVIAANKVKGARAAAAYDDYSAKMAKEHNNANILCLRGRNFSDEKNLKLVKIWLAGKFDSSARHERRIKKIASYER